ncbi:MAG: ABC transporter permease, partial [Clostridium sp.]|nr:ABC transporter permease [Clostridium sp.]
IALTVGIAASLINATVGILYGSISGYIGGRVDNIMMRIVDILYSVPLTLVVILIMVRFEERGLQTILLAIGLTYWIGMARLVRGQIMALKNEEYVLAARTLGASDKRILMKHLIPNALGPIVINLTMSIPSAIFTESFLAFIGIGLAPPLASLGTLCYDALGGYQIHPHMLLAPAGILCIMMLAFNFLGDGLRDALDPKMRR